MNDVKNTNMMRWPLVTTTSTTGIPWKAWRRRSKDHVRFSS